MMLAKLAWRNLWRQKRRTILTASAIALALFLALIMRSFQEGQYSTTIEASTRTSTGMIQLQNPEFRDSQSIDELLDGSEAFIQPAANIEEIEHVLPRVESFSLAAAGERSKGVVITGIDPQKDAAYTGLDDKLVKGSFIEADDNEVLLGEGVARYFSLDVGDEIIFYGQGYRGQTAAGVYTIKGILKFPMREMNNSLVYMPVKLAQQLFSTEGQVTSWVFGLHDINKMDQVTTELNLLYDDSISIRDWKDLSPELDQGIVFDRAGGLVMMYILYGIVGFGLFATLLMMTLERQREFAVMLATGMVRAKLVLLIGIESIIIGLLGTAIGAIIASPILIYYYLNPIVITGELGQQMLDMGYEPIIPVALRSDVFANQITIVLGMLLICLIYPIFRIYRLELVSALKGGSHAS